MSRTAHRLDSSERSRPAPRPRTAPHRFSPDRWPGLAGALFLALAAAPLLPAPRAAAQEVPTEKLDAMEWRHVGPTGGRTIAVAGEPGNPLVAYAGAAAGGVWRTVDGGIDWEPVFDDQPVQAIGALAVAPSAPDHVWAGTGETFYIRAYTSPGNGVYRSTNRGDSWDHVGLEETARISRIVVHPRDADVAYVCALGDAHGPQRERGVFRTTDGGDTWEHVLFVDEDTGCSDLAMDPNDARTLFAGMWPVEITGWNLHSGGPGGGVYVTHDGGESWEKAAGGLPEGPVGKTSVAVARSDPDRVYALLEGEDPSLYRSDDGGETWRLMSRSHAMVQRAPYYTRVRVDPDDRNRIFFLSTGFAMSEDGGKTVQRDEPTRADDVHDMWIDPEIPDRMLVAFDHGILTSPDDGRHWEQTKIPIAQLYHVAVDDRRPYQVYANRQDGPAYMGPSRTRMGGFFGPGGPTEGDWRYTAGCESGFALPDTANDRVWGGCYNGQLEVMDLDNLQDRAVDVWPMSAIGWQPKNVQERFYWVFPIEISLHRPERVYVGSQRVHVTTNGGESWTPLSPDLTRDLESHQESSTGFTTDNIMTFSGASLFSLAESPLEEDVLWAGSNDGKLHVSRDGGESWTDVTQNIPGIPEFPWISNVEPSHFDAGTAYVSVDDHMQGNNEPYVYKTTDYGETWEQISGDLPSSNLSYVHVVKEDPERPGLLYAGTERAVYFSLDDGEHWNPLHTATAGDDQERLPHAPAYWLEVQPEFGDLVLATFGRGIWILDDVSPLQQLDRKVLEAGVHLFEPRDPYRFQSVAAREREVRSEMETADPEPGVPLDYWLGEEAASDTANSVTLEVLDAEGRAVRTLEGTSEAGLNRVWWDLRHEPRKTVTLRTPPPNARWREVPREGLPSQQWGGNFQRGPEVVPGTYTVRLVAGDTALTREFVVRKDPHSKGSVEDIRAQVELSLRLQEEVNRVIEAVNRLEWIRAQLDDLERALEDAGDAPAVADSVAAVKQEAIRVENRFMDVHRPGGAEEFRTPMKLYGRYLFLMGRLDASADFPPTEQQREVGRELRERREAAEADLRALVEARIPALNEQLRGTGRPAVGTGGESR